MAEQAKVPEIRFAGFTDPWEQRKFSELASLRRGLTYSPADIRPYGQGIRVLRSSNIDEDEFTLSNEDVFVDETVVGIELVQEGEILITAANGSPRLVGKRAIINGLTGKTVHGGFMLCAHAEQPDYVAALMGSRWYQHFLATGVAGGNGSIGNLDKAALEDEFAFVPSIEEQELIGVLFSRLDDLITLHQRKRQWLKWLDEGGEGTHHDIDILVFKFADDMKISVLCGVHACMTKSLGHTGNRYAGKQQQRGMGVP